MRKRVRLGIVAILTLGTFVLVAGASAGALSSASTNHPLYRLDDSLEQSTQMTNIPYLAWRGETLRLVKCYPIDDGEDAEARLAIEQNGGLNSILDVKFVTEDWSGDPFQRPVYLNGFDGNRAVFFGEGESEGSLCASIHVSSQKAGIAVIKLNVEAFGELARFFDDVDDFIVLQHQFTAIWMQANRPTFLNVSGGTGLPGGPITDVAGDEGNVLQVVVTGTTPLGNNFSELGLGASLTFPLDWARFARVYARSTGFDNDGDFNPNLERNELLWDIHDDNNPLPDTHVVGYCLLPLPILATLIDQVDNCNGGGDDGPFSRVFGDNSGNFDGTVGPFDALRPDDTLLSDGKLDAGDAPMPPIRVDIDIEPNSGLPGDISGVGSLDEVDKDDVYVRNSLLPDSTPHNLYAPFYEAYIPARAAEFEGSNGSTASGTDGALINNNFAGYLVGLDENPYDYWEIAQDYNTAIPGPTTCVRQFPPGFRQTPAGDQGVVVYTDEHGEARVRFLPGTGFFFDELDIPDSTNINGSCDLQDIDLLGTADLTATARYPGQPVTTPDQASLVLQKRVTSLFDKSIECTRKGTTPGNRIIIVCVATAIDIDGTPFAGERVCFGNSLNEPIFLGPGFVEIIVNGVGRSICTTLNGDGQAVFEFTATLGGVVNVVALFVDERLARDAVLDTGAIQNPPPVVVTLPPVTPNVTPNVTPTVIEVTAATGVTVAQAVSLGGTPVAAKAPVAKAKAAKASLRTARLVLVNGKRHLMVRVNGASKTAKIRIIQVNQAGKVVSRATRIVSTNKQVRVGKLVIGKNVKTVRVSVL